MVGTTCEATWLELEVGEGGQVQGLGVLRVGLQKADQ